MLSRLFFIMCFMAFAKANAQTNSQTTNFEVNDPTQAATMDSGESFLNQMKAYDEKQKEMIGKPIESFEMVDMDGNRIASEDLKGKVTAINFWFKECKPCIEEMPELNKLVAKYEDKNVQFIAFCTTRSNKLDGFFEKHPFDYRQIANSGEYAQTQDIFFFPTNMILDEKGNIAFIHSGYKEGLAGEIDKQIKKLIK